MMDIPNMAMGFGFGAVAGAIVADMTGLMFLQTSFFFLGGALGAGLASGAFGEADFMDMFA